MARFLIAAWPVPGHINPCLAVACALRARGHDVAIYSAIDVRREVVATGIEFFAFRAIDALAFRAAEHPWAYSESRLRRLSSLPQLKAGLRRWLVDTIPGQFADLEQILAVWPAEVVVTVESMWAPILLLSETHQIPVAVFSTFAACLLPGPDVPAWGPGSPPPKSGLMRLQARILRKLQRWLSSDFQRAVNKIRQDYGLQPLRKSVTEFAGTMPLYLMPSLREFDYNRTDLPASVQYVGPCSHDKRTNVPAPAWLDSVPAGRPLVHVTEATVHLHEPLLLKAAARAFGGMPMQVVMTTGKHRQSAELSLGTLAPNIWVKDYVPHSDLMPRTSVLVSLGGAGTVMAALSAGVPMVIVPTEWDKPENAQRVVQAGVGIRIEPRYCTPERLREAVLEILADPGFRARAQRMAALCTASGGAARAAELLEHLGIANRAT